MPKIILKGHILVSAADLLSVTAELPNHRALTRQEPGCIAFDVTQDKQDPHRFYIYEEFVDRKAFDAHQQRAKNSHWGAISKNIERHYNITESSK